MDKPRILIIDDDDEVRTQMKWALRQQYDVLLAEDRQGALKQLKEHRPAVVTLDLGLPPSPGDTREGFAALADLLHSDPSLKVIVITGQGEKSNGVQAIAQGAYDFFCKPVRTEELRIVLARALKVGIRPGRFF
jgi:two-component system NtrC family response regulator